MKVRIGKLVKELMWLIMRGGIGGRVVEEREGFGRAVLDTVTEPWLAVVVELRFRGICECD